MKRTYLTLFCLLFGTLNLQAQNTKDTSEPLYSTLEELVLTANKQQEAAEDIPQQIQILKRKNIQQLMPQTSADALIQNGNVFVQKSQMGGGSPVIRGFEANSVLLVIDGVRMNNAIYRGGHLQNIITVDPNALERMEILTGPGSVIYGSDALGGVVHMYTLQPELTQTDSFSYSGSAFIRYASANNENTAHAHVNYGTQRWGLVSSLSFSSFEDLRMGSNNAIYNDSAFGNKLLIAARIGDKDTILRNENPLLQKLSGYSQVDLMQKVLFKQNERTSHLFNFQYSVSSNVPRYDRLSQFGTNDTPKFSEWYYGPQKRLLAAYSLRKKGKRWYNNMELTTSYQNLGESRHQRNFGDDNLRSRIEGLHVLGLNLDFLKEYNKKHELRYGAEVIYNMLSSEGKQTHIQDNTESPLDSRYPDGSSTFNSAIYGSYHWEIDSHWIVSAGARLNDYHLKAEFDSSISLNLSNSKQEQNNTVLTGNIGIVFKASQKIRLVGQLGTGFRNPNVDDVAKTFERDAFTIVLPINEVKPEKVFQQELGIDFFLKKNAWIELRAYHTRFQDAIATLPTQYLGKDSFSLNGRNLLVLSNTNIPEAQIQGANISFRYKINRYWSAKANFEITKGRDITNARPLSHIPPAFGSVYINYNKPDYNILFYTLFNLEKPISEYGAATDNPNFAPANGTPAWYTLNLKGRYNFTDRFRVQAALENLLDLNYRYFASGFSASGINGIVSLNYTF